MSNELAIAACTATLRGLLDKDFNGPETPFRDPLFRGNTDVTTLPLDKATARGESRRVNLFLYHVAPNTAWRNQTFPDRGQQYGPPLALNLHYLVTAYGDNEAEEDDHKLLGRVMTLFHEHATLRSHHIREMTGAGGPSSNPDEPSTISDSDIHEQLEKIRLTPEAMTVDEMMKLWGTFHQSPYRISTAYQASVVLLERRNRPASPFPVFGRNDVTDPGPNVQSVLAPQLHSIEYRDVRTQEPVLPSARVNDKFTILASDVPKVGTELRLIDPKVVPKSEDDDTNVIATLPILKGSSSSRLITQLQASEDLRCGRMAVVLQTTLDNGRKRTSNPLSLPIAPRIIPNDEDDAAGVSIIPTFHDNRRVLIAILNPAPGPKRKVTLFLTPDGSAEPPLPIAGVTIDQQLPLNADPNTQPTETQKLARAVSSSDEVVFNVHDVPSSTYRVRVRVETVESLPLRRIGDAIVMDKRQEVTL